MALALGLLRNFWLPLVTLLVGLLLGHRLGGGSANRKPVPTPAANGGCNVHTALASREAPQGAFALLASALTQPHLNRVARRHKRSYREAAPFPHVVLDGLFPPRVLEILASEVPERLDENGECAAHRSSVGAAPGESCFRQPGVQYRKAALNEEVDMGLQTREVFAFFKSSLWVRFLENLTNVKGILPDPHYRGSGVHMTAPGGMLGVRHPRALDAPRTLASAVPSACPLRAWHRPQSKVDCNCPLTPLYGGGA